MVPEGGTCEDDGRIVRLNYPFCGLAELDFPVNPFINMTQLIRNLFRNNGALQFVPVCEERLESSCFIVLFQIILYINALEGIPDDPE